MRVRGNKNPCNYTLLSWGPPILLIIALCYYGFYWRSGLMLGGEEGVAGVVAQRLNAGQRPIVDTFLGYNVGWFYPIAWLFKLTGPNYLVMRAYFFLLGFLAGIVAYTTTWLVTRNTVLALIAGLLVIVMPGVIGRNYMGMLGALGMLALLGTFILPSPRKTHRFLWMIFTGISLSLAWLIRIDLGFFQTTLFFLAALLFILKPEQGFLNRLGMAGLAISILAVSFLVIQGLAYNDAVNRGFGRQFTEQYWVWPTMIKNGASQVLAQLTHPVIKSHPAAGTDPISNFSAPANSAPEIAAIPSSPSKKVSQDEESGPSGSYSDASLKRPPLRCILTAPKSSEKVFDLLLYLPVLVAILFVLRGLLLIVGSLWTRNLTSWEQGAILLVSTGSSLALFPQYFFWRPDMIHLAEFMIPFMVTLVLGISLCSSSWEKRKRLARISLLLVILASALNLCLYTAKGWQTDGAGSIAAARRRHLDFTASNGVHVKLNRGELCRDTLIRDTIRNHSKPGDYVVCYPYFPMVNFMTDRPSYEYNLYADNAIQSDVFFEQATRNIEHFHPSVVIIGTGKLNNTEASRFPNWASKTYRYIRERFTLIASDDDLEIYASTPVGEFNPAP